MVQNNDNLGYWCSDAAARYPDAVALIDLSGAVEREVTYGELEARLNRFANLILGAGLAPGERMAIAVSNRFEFVEAMYGAMRAGVVPVPLNIKLGCDTLAYILEDSGCRAAVVEPDCNACIVEAVEHAGIETRFAFDPPPGWQAYESALMAQPERFDRAHPGGEHMAFLPYTSGSTGRPKGVVLTHAGQVWWLRAQQNYWPSDPSARGLVAVPMYHKNAMVCAIKPLLHVGGSVVILPDLEPRRFLETLSRYRCTQASAVPALFTRMLQHRDLIETLDLSALRWLKVGSAPVQEELMAAVEAAFGCDVIESYGLTEGGPIVIGLALDGRKAPFGSCGMHWPDGEIRLVGANGGEDAHFGELWLRNPGITPGYYRLPEVSAERLKDGWLATGDLFYRDDDGFLYFKGRTDDMFNSGGENIYPKQVENLLLSHPEVYDVAVVAVAHPVKGRVPVAMVMRKAGAAVTEAELKRYCLDNGPAFAHPRRIRLVEEMPLSGAGKIDRMRVQRELEAAFGGELAQAQ